MRYLLGVDFGGGSSKATLLDEDGAIVATASAEYPMLHPEMGFAEQNPEDIYRALVDNIRDILASARIAPERITALSLDAGTHIAVLLDRAGRVIRPAIYWSDNRSARQAAALAERHGARIMELACNAISPIWTLPQLQWIRENEPENFARINRILFLKDYLRFRLTGEPVTDAIDAMGAMLLDVEKGEWDGWLCQLCGLDPAVLPPIVEPAAIVGTITREAAAETGLSISTLVAAGATDTVMEVYASGAVGPGQATLKLATAGRICAVTERAVVDPMLVCYRHIVPGLWYPGTATKTCAASLRWYRDVLGTHEMFIEERDGVDAYRLMDDGAAKIPAGSDNLYFHPYLQGEITPHLDPRLKASFTGVSTFHTKAHFTRAVLEGVAFSLRDCWETLGRLDVRLTDTVRIIGGGSKSPLWRQIVADVLDIPMVKSLTDDSSIGSAMLAGVASGVFASHDEAVARCSRTGDAIRPDPRNREAYDLGFARYREIHDALAPIYRRIYS